MIPTLIVGTVVYFTTVKVFGFIFNEGINAYYRAKRRGEKK